MNNMYPAPTPQDTVHMNDIFNSNHLLFNINQEESQLLLANFINPTLLTDNPQLQPKITRKAKNLQTPPKKIPSPNLSPTATEAPTVIPKDDFKRTIQTPSQIPTTEKITANLYKKPITNTKHDLKDLKILSGMQNSSDEDQPDPLASITDPKEKRQMKNKLSARNFRIRRKAYIKTLENEVRKFRTNEYETWEAIKDIHAENKTLHSELNIIKEKFHELSILIEEPDNATNASTKKSVASKLITSLEARKQLEIRKELTKRILSTAASSSKGSDSSFREECQRRREFLDGVVKNFKKGSDENMIKCRDGDEYNKRWEGEGRRVVKAC
jgi:hypothetical protein